MCSVWAGNCEVFNLHLWSKKGRLECCGLDVNPKCRRARTQGCPKCGEGKLAIEKDYSTRQKQGVKHFACEQGVLRACSPRAKHVRTRTKTSSIMPEKWASLANVIVADIPAMNESACSNFSAEEVFLIAVKVAFHYYSIYFGNTERQHLQKTT